MSGSATGTRSARCVSCERGAPRQHRRAPRPGLWSALAWIVDEHDRPIRLHPSPVVALNDVYLPPETCIRLANRLGNWFTCTTLTFRRDALEKAGRFDATFMAWRMSLPR